MVFLQVALQACWGLNSPPPIFRTAQSEYTCLLFLAPKTSGGHIVIYRVGMTSIFLRAQRRTKGGSYVKPKR